MKNIKKNLVKAGLISLLAITPLASASCNKEHNAFEGADAMYLDNDFNKETPDKKFKIEGDGKVYNLEINGIDYEPMTPEKAMETYEKQYLKNKRSQRIEEIVSEYSKYLQDDDEILMKRAMNSYVEAMEAEKKAQRSTPEIWEVSGKRYKEFIFTLNDYQKKYGDNENLKEFTESLEKTLDNVKFDAILMASVPGDKLEIVRGDDILEVEINKITRPDKDLQNDDYNKWAKHSGYAKFSLTLNGEKVGAAEHYISDKDIYIKDLFDTAKACKTEKKIEKQMLLKENK